jgi:hypothetical protein
MNTQPTRSDEETLRAFRRFARDLWEARMSSSAGSELPRLRDYSLTGTRPAARETADS